MRKPRVEWPVVTLPRVYEAIRAVAAAAQDDGIPQRTLHLVAIRASQINGCGVSADLQTRMARTRGETDERLCNLATWRLSPCFTDAERAALALTEAGTRLADRPDAVPDEVFDEAARHYNARALAVLVIHIGLINFWNRINVTTGQMGGEWLDAYVQAVVAQ